MKIVCLDDHPTMLESLVRELNIISPESSVCAFQDAETALEYAEENGCDVLFCEIDLYGDDGLLFAEKIQAMNPRVNIIFTTVCEEGERAKEVFRIHPSGYITKPYTREQLAAELKNLRYPVESNRQAPVRNPRSRPINTREEPDFRSGSSYQPQYRNRVTPNSDSQRLYGEENRWRRGEDLRRRYPSQPDEYRSTLGDRGISNTHAAGGYEQEFPGYRRDAYRPLPKEREERFDEPEQVNAPPSQLTRQSSEPMKAQRTISDRELRRLSRAELLEILISQTKEKEALQQQLLEAERKLADRTLDVQNAGSIAQAAMKVNGVFEAAQRAADQYLDNVSNPYRRFSAVNYEDHEYSDRTIAETRSRCAKMERDTERKCADMINSAEAEIRDRWNELHRKINSYLREHEQLRNLMSTYR